MKKLPDDAFAIYLAMGARRSHAAVATQCGVDKKTVTNRAVKENWKQRIAEYEREQREKAEKKASETLEAMNERHLTVLSYIQGKAITTLKSVPLESAMEAIRAYTLAAEHEREIRGKPSTRSVIDLEQKIRAEHENWAAQDVDEPGPDATGEQESDGEADAAAPAVS